MQFVHEQEGGGLRDVEMPQQQPEDVQIPARVYHSLRLPADVRADVRAAAEEAVEMCAWRQQMDTWRQQQDTWRQQQDTDTRQWRDRQDDAMRWLIAGQQDMYRHLGMQARVPPTLGTSTHEPVTSSQQPETSSQQPGTSPPPDSTMFYF